MDWEENKEELLKDPKVIQALKEIKEVYEKTREQLQEELTMVKKKNKLLKENSELENGLITVEVASKMLNVTEIHLRSLLDSGKISYINLAKGKKRRSIRIEKKVIEEFIKQGGL